MPATSSFSPDLMRVTHELELELVLSQMAQKSMLTSPFSPDLIRVKHARPLNPVALAFVPFGIVKVLVLLSTY